MEYFLHRHQPRESAELVHGIKKKATGILAMVSAIGYSPALGDYEKRKLAIFNQLNFFQLITGVIVPIIAFLTSKHFSAAGKYIAVLPASISLLVLALNYFRYYQAALLSYFILYPVFTCVIYINGFNLGIELSFVLYGILSVFFLQDIGYMLFAVSLSMISYFVLSITWKDYRYQLEQYNYQGYLVNHVLSIIYIFYGLYLIKRENSDYQSGINITNLELQKKNDEVDAQRKEILLKARLLERQTVELNELNKVKDKLFSIISHDLKSPMYALQNVFTNAKKFDLPAEEIKEMIPEVVNDLNYTTTLIENLLQWAKSQMQTSLVFGEVLDAGELVQEAVQHLRLQSEEKDITIEIRDELTTRVWGDRNMISIVVRNLLSNAIKFTPIGGNVTIGTFDSVRGPEIFVRDTGAGISEEDIERINANQFFTTHGTGNEKGTGLGLALCKEFLQKNNSQLHMRTNPNNGSVFSFNLPKAK